MSRLLKVLILLAFALGILALLAGGLLYIISDGRPVYFIQREYTRFTLSGRQDDLNRPVGSDNSPVRFTVNPGDTPPIVAQKLYDDSLISDPDLYVDYAFVEGLDVEMEAGTYFPRQTMTIPDIARMLTDSSHSHIPFLVLEGWRLEEIADAIDASGLFGFTGQDFLGIVGPGAAQDSAFAAQVDLPPGASLEGFLSPDTYQLPPDVSAVGLRDELTETFLSKTGPQLRQDALSQGLTLYEAVTLASITERESLVLSENARIAAVYRNRLNLGMKLDADPTVQYGIGFKDGTWWPQITADDYSGVNSAYNTYLGPGLPPGPIANPGLSAIQAVVYPEENDYLYFRAACDGSGLHNFARSFEEHIANAC